MATKVAIQNGMHRYCKDTRLVNPARKFRLKLWLTASRMEKRISVLHGRPDTIISLECTVDCIDSVVGTSDHAMDSRQTTMLRLTDWLGRINSAIETIHSSHGKQRASSFEDLFDLHEQHRNWWQSLSDIAMLPASPPRAMVHLHLCYHLNIVFLGRPFVFRHAKRNNASSQIVPRKSRETPDGLQSKSQTLSRAAVQSARAIVELCQRLHDALGLARASYTEFSSCRAAIMTLMAHNLDTIAADDGTQVTSAPVNDSLAHGMSLIRLMASANVSAQSELSVLASLDAAIKHLASKRGCDESTRVDASNDIRPYDNLASWALGLRSQACELQSSHFTPPRQVEPFRCDQAPVSEWPSASEMWDGEAHSLLNVDDIFDFAIP